MAVCFYLITVSVTCPLKMCYHLTREKADENWPSVWKKYTFQKHGSASVADNGIVSVTT